MNTSLPRADRSVSVYFAFLRLTAWCKLLRFLGHVDCTGECWAWTGGGDKGYGRFSLRTDRPVLAHRYSYEALVGPIPAGLHLDHLCRNPACVRPDHLEPVRSRENTLRGIGPSAINARKTVCAHGHAFDEANTGRFPNGGRFCRECKRIRDRAHQARRRDRLLLTPPSSPTGALPPALIADERTDNDHQQITAIPDQLVRTSTGPTLHDGAEVIAGDDIIIVDGTKAVSIRIPLTVEFTTRNKRKKRTVSLSRTFTATAPRDLDFMGRHLHALRQVEPAIVAMAGEAFALAHTDKRGT